MGEIWDPDALRLLAAMTAPPPYAYRRQNNKTIRRMKRADIWRKNPLIYFPASQDAQSAYLNWASPGSDTLAPAGTGPTTHTAWGGIAGDGIGSYFTTGRALNALTNATQNSIHLSGRLTSTGAGAGVTGAAVIISTTGTQTNQIYARSSSANPLRTSYRANAGTSRSYDLGTPLDHKIANRDNSANQTLYNNGLLVNTDVDASVALHAGVIILCARPTTYGDGVVGFASAGEAYTAADCLAEYQIVDQHLRAIRAI